MLDLRHKINTRAKCKNTICSLSNIVFQVADIWKNLCCNCFGQLIFFYKWSLKIRRFPHDPTVCFVSYMCGFPLATLNQTKTKYFSLWLFSNWLDRKNWTWIKINKTTRILFKAICKSFNTNMTDNVKFLVGEINRTLKRDYNLITFDALSVENLLQVFVDVLQSVGASGAVILWT